MLNASAHTDCPNATCKQEIMKKLPDCPEEPPDLKVSKITQSFHSVGVFGKNKGCQPFLYC